MLRRSRRLTALLAAAPAVALALAAGPMAPASAESGTSEEPSGKVLLMLDASGSMNGKDGSGSTKIAAAKQALGRVIDAMPDDAQVGLRVYGATVKGGKPTPAACRDTQLVVPIGSGNAGRLRDAVASFKAKGETPIAYSLKQAAHDLGASGKRSIILVSDGEESCVADPCPTAKALAASGVDLQIDTVGLGANAKTRRQLQCIADAGHGTYYDAANASELTRSLNTLSQRALRPFGLSGTPVHATPDAASAPKLEPGQYTDSFAVSERPRYYLLHRDAGSTIHLAVTGRPPRNALSANQDTVRTAFSLPDGTKCGDAYDGRGEAATFDRVVNVSDTLAGTAPDSSLALPSACYTAADVLVAVTRTAGAGTLPVEVLYIDEPAVDDVTSLPPAPTTVADPMLAPVTAPVRAVVGGGSFSNALSLDAGTYSDTVVPGETIYYRVRLDFGQRAAFTVDAPLDGSQYAVAGQEAVYLQSYAYAPDRAPIGAVTGMHTMLTRTHQSATLGESTQAIGYRNREADATMTDKKSTSFLQVRPQSMAGYYYFAVGVARDRFTGSLLNTPVPVRVRVAVVGEPTGAPKYQGAAPPADALASSSPVSDGQNAAAHSTPESDGSGSAPWVLVGVGVLALALVVGGGVVLLRRRGQRDSTLQT